MKLSHIFYGIIAALFFGANYVSVKFYTGVIPPFLSTAVRLIAASIICLPVMTIPKYSFKTLYSCAIFYSVGFLGFSCLSVAIGSNVTSILILAQFSVPFTAILAFFLFKEHISKQKIIGIITSIIGSIIVVGDIGFVHNFYSIIFVLMSSFFLACYTISVKKLNKNSKQIISPFDLLGWVTLIGGLHMLIIGLAIETIPDIQLISEQALYFLIFSIIAPTFIGFGLWNYLLKIYSATMVAPFFLLVPLFGTLTAIHLLNEKLTISITIGGIITILGVGLILIKKEKKKL